MRKGRLEAFSDGVLAIIITVMILEMKVPHGDHIESLETVLPVFVSYVLSFIYIGIYWNNHHHMMQLVEHVNGKVLWANMHLLFWLSLIPFTSAWMGENNFTTWPVALYGFILFMDGIAYYILAHSLIKLHGKDSKLATALGKDRKGLISVVIYFVAILLAFVQASLSLTLYALVAGIWLVPDTRIERSIDR